MHRPHHYYMCASLILFWKFNKNKKHTARIDPDWLLKNRELAYQHACNWQFRHLPADYEIIKQEVTQFPLPGAFS